MKKMHRILSIMLAVAMLISMPIIAFPEAVQETEVIVEQPAPAQVAEPVSEQPVAEPNAESPNSEEPAAEEPVAEEPAVEEPVAEEPAAEEPVVEESVAEEPAVEVFAAKVAIDVFNEAKLKLGDTAYLTAKVTDANMSYSVTWQSRLDDEKPWENCGSGETYELKLTEEAAKLVYRFVITGADGTQIVSKGYCFPNSIYPVAESAPLASEENKEEEPVFIFAPAKEETVEEEPVAEKSEAEEPVAEEPAAEEPVEEEPAVEEPEAEEPEAEEPAVEEPVEEEAAVEEPEAEEPVVEEPAIEEPAEEESVAEEPVAEEPVIEEPVFEEAESNQNAEDNEKSSAFTFAPAPDSTEEIEIEDNAPALGLNETQVVTLTGSEDEEFQDVDVREGADGMAAIFTSLPEGAEVTVVDFDGEWATVIVDDQLGYIYKDDIADLLDLSDASIEEAPAVERKVTIFTSRRTVMNEGEPVYLTSKLEGFEDCAEIRYIWKVDKGNGFEEVPGANEPTYTFTATEESLGWAWHLTVLFR